MIKWEEWWNINVSLVLFTTICFIGNQWWGFTYMKKNCRINVQRKRLRIACPRCDDVDCGRYVGDWAWYWYLSSWPDWLNIWMSLANFRKRIAVALPMPVGLLRGIFVLSSFIQCRKKRTGYADLYPTSTQSSVAFFNSTRLYDRRNDWSRISKERGKNVIFEELWLFDVIFLNGEKKSTV